MAKMRYMSEETSKAPEEITSRLGISPEDRTSQQALSQKDALVVRKIISPWEIPVQSPPPCR